MSENNNIYSKAIPFMIVAAAVILFGTIATVFVPMMTKEMHPKLDNLKPYTAIELAGRNVYQKEGCFNCHTQTVRPLKADVLAYGAYSKAGENYYERPFLWGSKRTGPDLARIGGKYSNDWHMAHFVNPEGFFPLSNMPRYTWLANKKLDPAEIERCMNALSFPYTPADIAALKDKTELEAITAYMQVIGTAVPVKQYVSADPKEFENAVNPLAENKDALAVGRKLYNTNCFGCHGTVGQGTDLGSSMDMLATSDSPDGQLFIAIANGLGELMPQHINYMTKKDIWSLITYVRYLADQQAATQPAK